jgi:nucleoside-diphosphate-sugar epimerase/protein-tyrosine phosphatase
VEILWIETDDALRLAVVRRPRGGAWLQDEMHGLRRAGVDILVSMLTLEEAAELSLSEEGTACERAGMSYRSFSIPDGHVPVSRDELRTFVDELRRELRLGKTLAVHSRASIGRSSLLLACILCAEGWPSSTALARIAAARGLPVPYTKAQMLWIENFASSPVNRPFRSAEKKMENTSTGKVALFGAAGAIGHSISRALDGAGQPYRVVGRDQKRLQIAYGANPQIELATWNPDEPASVRSALRGVDTLIYLIGVPYNQFQLHPQLMRRTVEAAIAEGVKRIVLIGTVYPYGLPVTRPVVESHPRNPHTFKGRMRKAQEDILLAADREGKLRATILRLPDFYGPGVEASFLASLFQAAAHGGTANMVGPIDTPHEFVYVPDVGPVVLALAQKDEAYGTWWNLAGAGAMTQREIADRVFAMARRPPKLRVAGKQSLRLLGIFDPFLRELVEMHYLQTTPVLLKDDALRELIGPIHKTPYEEGLRECLEYARKHGKTG